MASVSQEPRATPSQAKSSIVVTSLGEIDIKATAGKVFEIILDNENYKEWNTWCPKFTLPEGQKLRAGSEPVMLFKMEKQEYNVPVRILEITSTPEKYRIAWKSLMLPSWLATIERVQEVEPLPQGGGCHIRTWESMSGLGAYVMKYLMGIQSQLDASNAQYCIELKGAAER